MFLLKYLESNCLYLVFFNHLQALSSILQHFLEVMFPHESTLMQLRNTKVTMEFMQKLMKEAVEYVLL